MRIHLVNAVAIVDQQQQRRAQAAPVVEEIAPEQGERRRRVARGAPQIDCVERDAARRRPQLAVGQADEAGRNLLGKRDRFKQPGGFEAEFILALLDRRSRFAVRAAP